MMKRLWQPELYDEMLHNNLRCGNPELTALLDDATSNVHTERQRDNRDFNLKRQGLLEGIMCAILRVRSIFYMPFLCLMLSILAVMTHTPRLFTETLRLFFRGVIADEQWTEDFIDEALEHNPGAPYTELPGVGAAMLDNLSIQVDQKGVFTVNKHGHMQHMTLWQQMFVPAAAAPLDFNVNDIGASSHTLPLPYPDPSRTHIHCVWPVHARLNCTSADSNTMFKTEMSMSDFTRLFSARNPEVVANKRARFTAFLEKAAEKTLFDRPNYVSPWRAWFSVKPAILNRLQLSYDDCKFEFETVREYFRSEGYRFVFLGGDGLTVGRGNHLMVSNMHAYLEADDPPWIIWVHGEHPHLTWHVLHAGHRAFWPFISICNLVLNNKGVPEKPNIQDHYHSLEKNLYVLVRSASEYLLEIASTSGAESIDFAPEFILKCESNIDLAWLVHFLYSYGFFFLDLRQSVRANRSDMIDLMWREFVPLGRLSQAHKTQYCPYANRPY